MSDPQFVDNMLNASPSFSEPKESRYGVQNVRALKVPIREGAKFFAVAMIGLAFFAFAPKVHAAIASVSSYQFPCDS